MSTVLITGASRGFGRELLNIYLEKGWEVFPLIRNATTISDIVSIHSNRCFPIVGDVTSELITPEIEKVLQTNANSLDVLINNAGNIKKKRGIMNTSTDDLKEFFDVHCVGAFRCTKAALAFLRKAKNPVVINITSRWGSIGKTASGNGGTIYSYNIAKSAQNMLTACLNQELKTENIKVFAVHPGRLKTAVAAPDADTMPEEAAKKMFEWIEQLDNSYKCKFYDLMGETTIEW